MKAVCLDSSGWIDIAEGGPNAEAFAEALHHPHSIVSSVISLYEISKYVTREAGEASAQELLAVVRSYPVITLTEDLALSAASLSAEHQLAMADSLIYATALANNATLWTQDVDFKGLPNVRYFPKIKP
jgi:predicted nucleic acid-binding protein